jgi:hypothetical protein
MALITRWTLYHTMRKSYAFGSITLPEIFHHTLQEQSHIWARFILMEYEFAIVIYCAKHGSTFCSSSMVCTGKRQSMLSLVKYRKFQGCGES